MLRQAQHGSKHGEHGRTTSDERSEERVEGSQEESFAEFFIIEYKGGDYMETYDPLFR